MICSEVDTIYPQNFDEEMLLKMTGCNNIGVTIQVLTHVFRTMMIFLTQKIQMFSPTKFDE